MRIPARFVFPLGVLLTLFMLLPPISAKAGAASFCKCICGSESQIIALNPPTEAATSLVARGLAALRAREDAADGDSGSGGDAKEGDADDGKAGEDKKRTKTCNDCNRQFCLDYNLPKCKALPAEEVTTACFQRDSSKDQAVVLLFIAATVSLLGWAVLRPWVAKFLQNARDRTSYARVPVGGDGHE